MSSGPLGRRVHLIGIGGAGGSGVARLLLSSGVEVSGSDAVGSASVNLLRELGARACSSDKRPWRFEVHVSQRAIAQMRTETRHGRRLRGARVETGGMLLGSVDEAARCVYVDIATGPSPDSVLTAQSFDFGTDGSDEAIQHYRQRTHDRCHFVGIWHTHPSVQLSRAGETKCVWLGPSPTGPRSGT
jgi:hypothetical protein